MSGACMADVTKSTEQFDVDGPVDEPQEAERMSKSKITLEKSGRGPDRRDTVVDRRTGIDRREIPTDLTANRDGQPLVLPDDAVGMTRADNSLDTNLERRRGPGRRRTDFMKSAEEGEMSPEQFLFVMAIDAF